ncbi:GntR family transcriptional regulator [Qaidamihabitans albus]|uniref:GntR family transcriptional regulator n=1 Tax=Qaidamihabitans albus TaxID=2795733 RepID=UPI0018F121EA|nr:GntR family transcriptional regulator [Qaidamihabitans albus]
MTPSMSPGSTDSPAASSKQVPTARDNGRSATETVADQLRERIKYGRLAPGQRLVEVDLIHELRVSRSTIRAAFSQLASEGIIILEHNRGAHVRVLDLDGIRQLYEVRATLEGRAAGLTAQRVETPGCRQAMHSLLEHSSDFSDGSSFAAYWNYNENLHRTVLQFAGNDMLRQWAEQARTLTYHYHLRAATAQDDPGRPVSISHACEQHQLILEAILAGDADRAEAAMREHIHANGKGIRAFMQRA